MINKKPNLFIVGAAKCGTSSMHYYLSKHPEIFMAPDKELKFFGTDIHPTSLKNDKLEYKRYENYFALAKDQTIVGESSPQYIYSHTAASEIIQYNPDAKILILLRNPVDMVPSLHQQLINVGIEKNEKLIKALEYARVEDNLKRINYKNDFVPSKTNYWARGYYAPQVRRYLNIFGRNVKIVLFEDLKVDFDYTMEDIFKFLDVNPNYKVKKTIVNKRKKIRYKKLHQILLTDSYIRRFVYKLIGLSTKEYVKGILLKLNSLQAVEQEIDQEVLNMLYDFYIDKNQELEKVINRDLSAWYNVSRSHE